MAVASELNEVMLEKGIDEVYVERWSDLARLLGYETQTLKNFATGKDYPGEPGRFPVGAWARWRIDQLTGRGHNKASKQEWETKKLERQVEQLDLQIAQERRELIPCEEVQRDCRVWLTTLRSRLTTLGSLVAELVPGELKAKVKRSVEDKVWAALEEARDAVIAGIEIESDGGDA